MTQAEKIERRLARLENQKAYIYGMLAAERAHENGTGEKEALGAACAALGEKHRQMIKKGYRTQKNAIEKRTAAEEQEKENLFTMGKRFVY